MHALAKRHGVKGHSLFFAPTLPDRQRNPKLSYLWDADPVAGPYNPMHLILQNVVPLLWTIFSGEYGTIGVDRTEQYIMSPPDVRAVRDEIAAACKTIPLSQARALRNIATRCGSNKASDWMNFLLCPTEAVLADRLPQTFYSMFISLTRACQLLFRPHEMRKTDVQRIENDFQIFCEVYFSPMNGGLVERIPLCRSVLAGLLDVVPLLRACGPTWVFWQFPIERYIGSCRTDRVTEKAARCLVQFRPCEVQVRINHKLW